MATEFWVKRFVTVLTGAFIIICSGQIIQGHTVGNSIMHGGIWSPLTACLFTVSRYFQARNGQHCAICKDTPEMQGGRRGDSDTRETRHGASNSMGRLLGKAYFNDH